MSGNSSFDIGSAIVNSLTLSINNFSGKFTDYIWDDARVVCYIGMQTSAGIEKIRICTMTVTNTPYQSTAIINLTCEDYMRKFDRDYSDSKLTYPATRLQIVQDACEVCGVTLQTTSFDNSDFVIKERPDDSSLTFRQVIAWVAQMGCQWAKCDAYGRLCLGWYEKTISKTEPDITAKETQGFTPWLYDITITGIQVTEYVKSSSEKEAETVAAGSEGYVIEISDNKLIQEGSAKEICGIISNRCVGMKFRPFNTGALTNIAWEAGDSIVISDRNGKTYQSYITTLTLNPGSFEQLECGAQSVSRQNQKQYSLTKQVKSETKKDIKDERAAREKALQDLAERLGESSGVFTTIVEQEDGSNIYYLHNKPKLEDSDMVWKMTAEAWAVSTDGGKTWNGGMTVDGDVIARILAAKGINADWINTGTIKGVDKDGNTKFLFDVTTGRCIVNLDELQIQGKDITQVTEEKTNQQINKFIKDTYAPSLNNLQSQVDGKIQTWHQDTDPSLEWESTQNTPWTDKDGNPILDMDGNPILMEWEDIKAMHEGDLWYNTSNNTQWIYQSGVWVPQDIPNSVLKIINGKSSIYVKQPVPPYEKGDLWLTSLNNKEAGFKTSIITRTSGDFVASDWIDLKYTDTDDVKNAINNYDKTLTQAEIFKKLSNDGKIKGLWIKDGELYFSFSFAQGGTLKLGGKNNGNGIFEVYDDSDKLSYKITNNGNVFYDESGNCTSAMIDGKILFPDEPFAIIAGEWSDYQKGFIYGSKGMNRFNGRVYGNTDGTVKFEYTTESFDGYYSPIFALDDTIHGFFDILRARKELIVDTLIGIPNIDTLPEIKVESIMKFLNKLELYKVPSVSSGGNLVLGTDGRTISYLSSSSERYKNLGDAISKKDVENWYNIEPLWAKYKGGYLISGDENENRYIPMFTAENVEKHMPEAVRHQDGKVEDWNYRVMIPAMFAMLKNQKSEIDELKQEIEGLKKKVK